MTVATIAQENHQQLPQPFPASIGGTTEVWLILPSENTDPGAFRTIPDEQGPRVPSGTAPAHQRSTNHVRSLRRHRRPLRLMVLWSTASSATFSCLFHLPCPTNADESNQTFIRHDEFRLFWHPRSEHSWPNTSIFINKRGSTDARSETAI